MDKKRQAWLFQAYIKNALNGWQHPSNVVMRGRYYYSYILESETAAAMSEQTWAMWQGLT